MADESNFARSTAASVALDPVLNGKTNVQDALAVLAPAAWNVAGVPTADPHVVGRVWANSGVLTVSAG